VIHFNKNSADRMVVNTRSQIGFAGCCFTKSILYEIVSSRYIEESAIALAPFLDKAVFAGHRSQE